MTPQTAGFGRSGAATARDRVARSCTATASTADAVTARPGHVAPETIAPPEQSERLLRLLARLDDGVTRLAYQMVDNGEGMLAGELAATAVMLRATAATIDTVASRLNHRPLRRSLHGIRDDTGGTTPPDEQLSFLRQG